MEFVKVIYKNDYDSVEMRGKRPLLRAYNKLGISTFIDEEDPFVLGYMVNGSIHEFLTHVEINASEYEVVDTNYVKSCVGKCDNIELEKLHKLFLVIFNQQQIDLGCEISNSDEIAKDRAIQFEAYNNNLTSINPYDERYINCYTASAINDYGVNSLFSKVESKGVSK